MVKKLTGGSINMARFTLPRDLYHGEGSLAELKNLKGKKAVVVVGGGSMKRFGFLQKVEDYLKEAGMEVALFEGVEPDPSVETVMKGAKLMQEFGPDWIVAIGGGSPIDAAKAMWAFYEYPDTKFEDLITPFNFPTLRTKAKFCAIPSTSGTATEVTAFSVITDYHKGIKYPLADFNITPDVAIVDPELAETMPQKLVAHTGMDAMTHAIEAYVSTVASPYTDALAMKAIEMVTAYLPSSYNGNRESRAAMHDAQCLAGMAFSNVGLGVVHGMAHPLGAIFDIPHGVANALLLPIVMEFNAPAALDKYVEIAKAMNVYTPDMTREEAAAAAVKAVRELSVRVGIPQHLSELGIKEEDLDKLAAAAFADVCTPGNPREVSKEIILELYKKAL